jgi:hypothetical protein
MAKKTSIISEGAEALEQAFKEAQAIKKAEKKGPALPLNLQRAKPKTPQEITDIADRIARQQLGEHVTSGKKGDTKNLAGRSMKESKRVQDLNYELERIKKIQPSPEITGNVGEINLAIPGDQTISDYILKNLEGLDIESPQQGGARYGWGHLDKEDPLFWASGKQPATAFQNKVNRLSELYGTDEIMAHHLAMGDTANNFAMHFADANLRAINNSDLKKKSINAFNKVIEKQFPDFVGVENPEEAYLQMQANPELRKYFNDRMKTPSITQPLGLPNGLDIQWAITEPALRNMEISLTGHSVGRLKPRAELTETADHGTYSHGIQGEILGHAPELAPFEMSFPDADLYLRSVYNPENITGTIQKVAPHQVVDPQYLDQMNEYYTRLRQIRGFAKGGKVNAFTKLLEETNSALNEAKQSKEAAKQLNRIAGADVATSKDLTDVNDFHAGMMDEIRRRAAETKKQMDEFNYTYSPGDNIFTEWSAKNNKAPYKILDKAMTSTKMLGRDEQGNKIYAPRKPGYWVEQVTPDGVQKFILPEEAIAGRVDLDNYAKGGKVGKAAGILEELNKAYEEAKAIKTLTPKVEAPTIIVPKRGKIKDIQDKVRKERGNYAARRVERAADEVPNLEHQYTQNALEREFTASNPQALMVLNPKDFEEFAHPLSPTLIGRTENYGGFNVPEDMSYDQYIEYLASIARDQGLTDVPYLRINETPEGKLIISGHEGRHRTRALSKLGDESTLISLDPSYSLTPDEARRYKEDYIDALNARFGLDRLITPEYRPEVKGEVKRSPIIMPDLFAKGGTARARQLAKMGAASKPAPAPKATPALARSTKKQVAQNRLQSVQALQAKKAAQAVAPAPLQTVAQAPAAPTQATAPLATATPAKAPMYTPHEGMLFGNDFYERYAQNVGGQFKDPYHNFLVTRGVGSPNGPKIEDLYKQYQASGRTDTPDWATAQIKPISFIPKLSHSWDASGATPVTQLSSAWSPTTPLAEGVTVPEGYWDARLAYNMNLSKAHPDLFKPEDYASGRVSDYNDTALFALKNNIFDINDPRVSAYEMQKAAAQQHKGAVGSMEVNALHRAHNDYMRGQQAQQNMQGNSTVFGGTPTGFAKGGKVDLEQEFINADTVHMAEGGWNSPYATKNKKSPTQPMSLPDLDTLALTGKILAKKGKQQLKKELANPSPQMAVDVLGNVGADLLGMPADMIESARGTPMKGYKPFKGVDLTPKGTPMLGSENLRGQLEKAGITSGEERPLTENLAMMGLPFAGELKGLPAGLSIKDVSAAAEEAKRAVNFVSSVERTIKGHKMDAMPGNQWSAWMKSNASKAAKKEADTTGLHDWLSQQTGKVTKADIEAYVEGNLPQTKVTTRGVPKKLSEEENERYKELWKRHNDYQYGRAEGLDYPEYEELMRLENIVEKKDARELRKEAESLEKAAKAAQARGDKLTAQMNFSRSEHVANRADAMELTPELMTSTKFEKYTEPGGQNYRETVISLPKREPKPRDVDLSGYYVEEVNEGGTPMYRAVTPNTQGRLYSNRNSAEQDLGVYTDNIKRSGEDTENFKVSPIHGYGVEDMDVNRLAHLRTKERLTPDEKRVLFMEELQSDWAQKGRDAGFRGKTLSNDELEELYSLNRRDSSSLNPEELKRRNELLQIQNDSLNALPSAPYVTDTKDWTALGLKHALKQAAEEGQDYLAWTTGQQQADRYSLAQYLDNVRATKNPDGTYSFLAYERGASRNNLPTIRQEGLTEDELSEHLGKDMAKKIVGDLAEAKPTQVANYNNLDLQIGGEGMKGYYDQIVPQTMNDVLKQLGVSDRVKTIPLKTGRDSIKVVDNYTNEPLPIDFDSYEDASSYMGDAGLGMNEYTINVNTPDLVQHMGIELTPELKEKLFSEGLPHFHEGGKVEYNKQDLLDEFKISRYGA